MSRYNHGPDESRKPSAEHTFEEMEFDGELYTVDVEVDWESQDDSFDHEFGTEYLYSWIPEDFRIIRIVRHNEDETDEEMDESDLGQKFIDFIAYKVDEIDTN